MSEYSSEYQRLVKYVNAATDLAESVTKDIKKSKKTYSNDTVLALSRFIASANAFQKILDQVQKMNVRLN